MQSEPRDGAFESIGPGSSAKGKEKADTDHGHSEDGHKRDGDRTATGAIGIQDLPKRTAGNTGFKEGGKVMPGSGKIRRKGQSAGSCRSIPYLMVFERPYRRYR